MAAGGREETTQILSRAVRGDRRAAEELIPCVYDELRKLAADYLRRERPDHTLQPTALVNEAYLRLVDRTKVDWRGKTHFLAVAAREMRRVLIHHARAHKAQKRGGGWIRVNLDQVALAAAGQAVDLHDLVDALEKHAELYPRQARLIELRFFGGLGIDEAAKTVGISPKTVEKDLRMARAWLYRHLKKSTVAREEQKRTKA